MEGCRATRGGTSDDEEACTTGFWFKSSSELGLETEFCMVRGGAMEMLKKEKKYQIREKLNYLRQWYLLGQRRRVNACPRAATQSEQEAHKNYLKFEH
ncbi:hypothetical protein HAX54_018509 [Datura stramonium]|uniref:Uncharacterized protein n=1 Tax=Datura stramonium TaxID=4076 RepID=A0ABS8S1H0_DATST|nr:hypothetical protein [Datura stramonium]